MKDTDELEQCHKEQGGRVDTVQLDIASGGRTVHRAAPESFLLLSGIIVNAP